MQPVCWIVGAADFDGEGFAPQPGDFVIAADGGYAHLQRIGIDPDMVLGDFDSLGAAPQHRCIVRHPVIKDDPDSHGWPCARRWKRGTAAFCSSAGLGGAG